MLLVVGGCGQTLTLGPGDADPHDPSPTVDTRTVETTKDPMLPAPPSTSCANVGNDADNCGFCGHSCRGAACEGGLCAPEPIASAAKLGSFATNGTEVYYIDDHGAFRCAIGSKAPCSDLVTMGTLVARGWSPIDRVWDDLEDRLSAPFDSPSGRSLTPIGIALLGERVFVTDESSRAILVCPTNQRCDATSLGIVQTAAADDLPFRAAVAVGTASIAWAQGSGIFGAAVPAAGTTTTPSGERLRDDTQKTARLSATDLGDLYWLSSSGLYHSGGLRQSSSRLYPIGATDFAVDPLGVFVATPNGLARVLKVDQKQTLVASGAFGRVASDGQGVVATKTMPSGTAVVKLAANVAPLPLAAVPGNIDSLVVTTEWVYYATTTDGVGTVFRVAR